MRVTEQGEVIAQKYANRVTATFQLERLLAGVTRTTLLHGAPHRGDADSRIDLARRSRNEFRGVSKAG